MAFTPLDLTNKKKSVGQGLQRTDAFPTDIWQLWDKVSSFVSAGQQVTALVFNDPTNSDPSAIKYFDVTSPSAHISLAQEVAKNAIAYSGFPFTVVDHTGTPHSFIVSGDNVGERGVVGVVPTGGWTESIAKVGIPVAGYAGEMLEMDGGNPYQGLRPKVIVRDWFTQAGEVYNYPQLYLYANGLLTQQFGWNESTGVDGNEGGIDYLSPSATSLKKPVLEVYAREYKLNEEKTGFIFNPLPVSINGAIFTGLTDVGTTKIQRVSDPVEAQDAATKNYVDNTSATVTTDLSVIIKETTPTGLVKQYDFYQGGEEVSDKIGNVQLPIATTTTYGLVKTSTDEFSEISTGPVGTTNGKLSVPVATASRMGVGKLTTDTPQDKSTAGQVGMYPTGEFAVLSAQTNRAGVVKPSTNTQAAGTVSANIRIETSTGKIVTDIPSANNTTYGLVKYDSTDTIADGYYGPINKNNAGQIIVARARNNRLGTVKITDNTDKNINEHGGTGFTSDSKLVALRATDITYGTVKVATDINTTGDATNAIVPGTDIVRKYVTDKIAEKQDKPTGTNTVYGQNNEITQCSKVNNNTVIGYNSKIGYGNNNTILGVSNCIYNNVSSSIAIGYNNEVSGNNGISLGYYAKSNEGSIVIGNCTYSKYYSIVVGNNTSAVDSTKSIVIGNCTFSHNGWFSVVIGSDSSSVNSSSSSVVIGPGNKNCGIANTIVGSGISMGPVGTGYGVAIGNNVKSVGDNVTIGSAISAVSYKSIAVGHYAENLGYNSITIGDSSRTGTEKLYGGGGCGAIAIGVGAKAFSDGNIAIGFCSKTSGLSSITIGSNTYNGGSNNSIVIGPNAKVWSETYTNSIVIGSCAISQGVNTLNFSTADPEHIFLNTATDSPSSLQSFIDQAVSSVPIYEDVGISGLAIGTCVHPPSPNSVAVGINALTMDYSTVAIGTRTEATRQGSTAIGSFAKSCGIDAIAIGHNAYTNVCNSFAIPTVSPEKFYFNSTLCNSTSKSLQEFINETAISATSTKADTSALETEKSDRETADTNLQTAITNEATTRSNEDNKRVLYGSISGANSLAVGGGSKTLGNQSLAVSTGAQATGVESTAVGNNAVASGGHGVAVGFGATVTHDGESVAIGTNVKSQASGTFNTAAATPSKIYLAANTDNAKTLQSFIDDSISASETTVKSYADQLITNHIAATDPHTQYLNKTTTDTQTVSGNITLASGKTLSAPILEATNYFVARSLVNEIAYPYNHSMYLGYAGHNYCEFFEIGCDWRFLGNDSTIKAQITNNGIYELGTLLKDKYASKSDTTARLTTLETNIAKKLEAPLSCEFTNLSGDNNSNIIAGNISTNTLSANTLSSNTLTTNILSANTLTVGDISDIAGAIKEISATVGEANALLETVV